MYIIHTWMWKGSARVLQYQSKSSISFAGGVSLSRMDMQKNNDFWKALDCPSCSTGSHTGWRSCGRCASDHHEHCVQTHPKHTPNAPSQGSPVFATLDATVSGVESHEQAEWEKGFWKVPLQHASSASSVSVSCRELPCCYQGACEWCGWDWCGGNCRNSQRSALPKSKCFRWQLVQRREQVKISESAKEFDLLWFPFNYP
jgi:hypothetical protein